MSRVCIVFCFTTAVHVYCSFQYIYRDIEIAWPCSQKPEHLRGHSSRGGEVFRQGWGSEQRQGRETRKKKCMCMLRTLFVRKATHGVVCWERARHWTELNHANPNANPGHDPNDNPCTTSTTPGCGCETGTQPRTESVETACKARLPNGRRTFGVALTWTA